jgi:hypothetical protein
MLSRSGLRRLTPHGVIHASMRIPAIGILSALNSQNGLVPTLVNETNALVAAFAGAGSAGPARGLQHAPAPRRARHTQVAT